MASRSARWTAVQEATEKKRSSGRAKGRGCRRARHGRLSCLHRYDSEGNAHPPSAATNNAQARTPVNLANGEAIWAHRGFVSKLMLLHEGAWSAALARDLPGWENETVKRSGVADLPLHGGRVPAWLAARMETLGTAITESVLHHYGRAEISLASQRPVLVSGPRRRHGDGLAFVGDHHVGHGCPEEGTQSQSA